MQSEHLLEKLRKRDGSRQKWDLPTPGASGDDRDSSWDGLRKRTKWDATPVQQEASDETPRRSRWDATPVQDRGDSIRAFDFSSTKHDDFDAGTKLDDADAEHLFFSDQTLDLVLPVEGFEKLTPPEKYAENFPSRLASFGVAETAISFATSDSLLIQKPDDFKYFSALLQQAVTGHLPLEEAKRIKVLQLLLRIKNGDPSVRRIATRQIVEKARDFGPGVLFDNILPLFLSVSLEDQERHFLIKIIDRILVKFDEQIRPYVHKILLIIKPLLIDDNFLIRSEGKGIICNLTKAAGLASMIVALRPDIDHSDEGIRNTTCRALTAVASTLGVGSLLPFLKAICSSKKSWYARHSGMRVIQNIAVTIRSSVLPNLKELIDLASYGLSDDQIKVRTAAALGISALAEAVSPNGIEFFKDTLGVVLKGIKVSRGKSLAAQLKAIGSLLPLMGPEQANFHASEIFPVLIREFRNPDEEMKRVVLRALSQALNTSFLGPQLIKDRLINEFLASFWTPKVAEDKKMSSTVTEVTLHICRKIGIAESLLFIVLFLKDDSSIVRRMAVSTSAALFSEFGVSSVDPKIEARVFDGLFCILQDSSFDDFIFVKHFAAIIRSFGKKFKPYISQLTNTLLWHLSNRSAKVRQNAAELIAHLADVIFLCDENVLSRIGMVLYENLGEEFPDVLASILFGLKMILLTLGATRCSPSVKELLPKISPVLRNRHELVQEHSVNIVGIIAEKCPEAVSAREWMRICFELLDLLRSPRKMVRRAAIVTFGTIAKAIGPHDVLTALLNNLKVQERQNRVCTTVAIAIVAEACSPFTVIPALMNEYRVPELNVQNGVLKAFSFLFEYIGELAKDYIFAVTPLLEDALVERDLVHRQISSSAVKHMALGVLGFGCEEALIHLLNLIWPNIFETSPHVINSVIEAVDSLNVALGPATLSQYLFQGLFHPARKVRDIYWKTFNNCYIMSSDALVLYYPRISSDFAQPRPSALNLFI